MRPEDENIKEDVSLNTQNVNMREPKKDREEQLAELLVAIGKLDGNSEQVKILKEKASKIEKDQQDDIEREVDKAKSKVEVTDIDKSTYLSALFTGFLNGYQEEKKKQVGENVRKELEGKRAEIMAMQIKRLQQSDVNSGELSLSNLKGKQENSGYIICTHDNEGKETINKFNSLEEVEQHMRSGEMDKVVHQAEEAEKNGVGSASYCFVKVADDKKLTEELSAAGIDIKNGDHAKEAISAVLKSENVELGQTIGDHFKDYGSHQEKENINQEFSIPTRKVMFQEKELPWKQLKNIGLTKENMDAGTKAALMAGCSSGMIHGRMKVDKENAVNVDMKIRLVRDLNNQIRIVPSMADNRSCKQVLEETKDYRGYQLSAEDKENLLKSGTTGKACNVEIAGKRCDVIIGMDKDTHRLFGCNTNDIKLPKKLGNHELETKEKEELLKGKPVKMNNLVDKSGQQFSGWVKVNPATKGLDVSQKYPLAVDTKNKIQVENNNNGGRDESVKNDKDAKLDSGQTENNDAKPEKTQKTEIKETAQATEKTTTTHSRGMHM